MKTLSENNLIPDFARLKVFPSFTAAIQPVVPADLGLGLPLSVVRPHLQYMEQPRDSFIIAADATVMVWEPETAL